MTEEEAFFYPAYEKWGIEHGRLLSAQEPGLWPFHSCHRASVIRGRRSPKAGLEPACRFRTATVRVPAGSSQLTVTAPYRRSATTRSGTGRPPTRFRRRSLIPPAPEVSLSHGCHRPTRSVGECRSVPVLRGSGRNRPHRRDRPAALNTGKCVRTKT